MTDVEVLLFDLDGTLINSLSDLTSSVNLMLKDLGRHTLSEADVRSFVGDGVSVLVKRSLAATHPDSQPPDESLHSEAVKLMRKHYADQMFVTTGLYPLVAETLARLKEKKMGVVTAKEAHFTGEILERFGIAQYFGCVIGGDTLPERKPNPAPLFEAIKKLGGSIGKTVMIGDSENDVTAGKNAGISTCAVTYGFRTTEQLLKVKPDVIIDRFDQLIEFFR